MGYDDYRQLRDLFVSAEKKIKLVEQLDEEVVIPAVNQLRYVGQHVLESMFSDEKEHGDHIQEAEIHAKRAAYDALEAGILCLLARFEQFRQDFRMVQIGDVVPDYLDICVHVDKIRETLTELENRNHTDMNGILEEHLKELQETDTRFRIAREELSKKLNSWRQGIAIGLASILVALLGVIVAIILA